MAIPHESPNLIDRTFAGLLAAWQSLIKNRQGDVTDFEPNLPESEHETLKSLMTACLQRQGGEVAARARAATLGNAYLRLNSEGKRQFLHILANEFDTDFEAIKACATSLIQDQEYNQEAVEAQLRTLLTPPYMHLLTQFNALPQGVKFLVDLRADLLSFQAEDPTLMRMADLLKLQLTSWFDIGFLELKSITWEAPASLLEKLISYEAVHEIKSWADLKNRLSSDRRCFAFFHPRMPEEPLIFVQVALVDTLSDNIQSILDESAPKQDTRQANTAIFYSISNTQVGLQGVSLGNFLIKRVVDSLSRDYPNLKTFSTLSPIPGFGRYLKKRLDTPPPSDTENMRQLAEQLQQKDWHLNEPLCEALKIPLMQHCAHYLVNEKKGHRAYDPVANFHLNNGARLARINWLGDTSSKGLQESFGLMVNYVYELAEINQNHERYRANGEVVTSKVVRSLLSE